MKPIFADSGRRDQEKMAEQLTGKSSVADQLVGWVPAQGTLADGRPTPNFAAFDLPDGSNVSPLLATARCAEGTASEAAVRS